MAVKKDIVILKSTGKVALMVDKIECGHGVAYILDGHATPSFQASPFVDPYPGTFKLGCDYEVIHQVSLEDAEVKAIQANKQRYVFDKATSKIVLADTLASAGYDRTIRELAEKVVKLEQAASEGLE